MKRLKSNSKLLLFLCGIFIISSALAQERTITGTVTDGDSKEPLAGATVVVEGTTNGVTSDLDGNFQIQASDESVLLFSFIGYINQSVAVEGKTEINMELQLDVKSLEEVVVIGYGTVKKEDMTGAVSVVGSDDFNKGTVSTADQLLTGKAAGVQIINDGGQPGGATQIRIRGGSSLSSTNDPLIIIDGVPMATTGIDGMSNPLSTVHPDDIETVTVLKDASATAIYGSRASNGVIIITTKTGSSEKIKVSYSGKVSLATPSGKIDNLNTNEFRSFIQEELADNQSALDALGDVSTDWQDEIMTSAFGTDHNISVNGTVNEFMPYRASIGYTNQDGILKTSNMERLTGALNLNPSFLDNHLTVGLNLKGMQIKNQFAETGAVNNAVIFDPTQPVTTGEEEFGGYFAWVDQQGAPITIAPRNPVAQLEQRDNNSTVNRVIGNVKLDYKMHFLPELKATINVGSDRSYSDGSDFTPEDAAWDNQEGRKTNYWQTKFNDLLDIYLNYDKEVESIKSRFSVTAGYSYQYFFEESFSETTKWDELDTLTKGIPRPTDYVILSYFGRLNYVYADKYMLTLTLRNDITSRFSEETRAGLFPAAAFAWDIKDESFMYNVPVVSNLKLRLGYGVTGQQYISDDNYPYYGTYRQSTPTAQYLFGDTYYLTQRPEGYNPTLKWEETTTYNIGLDFGFNKNRFTGTIELYQRESEDLINEIDLPAGSNFTNRFVQNIGTLENKGVEFTFNAKAVSTTDWLWDIGFNLSYNENKITKLTLAEDSTFTGVETGGISGGVGNNIQIHTVGYPSSSYYVYEQVYDENGNAIEGLYVDRNGDGTVNELDKYHHEKPTADVSIGINSTINYKQLSLSFSGRLNLGNYVYNNIESQYTDLNGLYHSTGYLNNRHRSVYDLRFDGQEFWSDYYIQNGSFFRMDHITLSYFFNNIINDKTDLQVYGTVQNAFVITKYKGLDPELDNGIDNSVFPRPRTFTLGVKVDF